VLIIGLRNNDDDDDDDGDDSASCVSRRSIPFRITERITWFVDEADFIDVQCDLQSSL